MNAPENPLLPTERTMVGALGIELIERTDDTVRGRLPVSDQVRQPYGIVHGGAILALAETLASVGTALGVVDDGRLAMGQELNASYLRPISEGHVNATARARRKGRSAWIWEVEITDDGGRLCSLVRITIAVREPSATMSETIRGARGQSEAEPSGKS